MLAADRHLRVRELDVVSRAEVQVAVPGASNDLRELLIVTDAEGRDMLLARRLRVRLCSAGCAAAARNASIVQEP